jgi:hypothetical protein
MTGYAPAGKADGFSCQKSHPPYPPGYVADNTQFIRGFSPLHDSGTGSSLGLAVTQVSHGDPHVVVTRDLWKLRDHALDLSRWVRYMQA